MSVSLILYHALTFRRGYKRGGPGKVSEEIVLKIESEPDPDETWLNMELHY